MNKLIFEKSVRGRKGYTLPKNEINITIDECLDSKFLRKTELNLPEVSELDVQRHFITLSHKNHFIEKGFYPLGSCTMKYNPKLHETIADNPKFTQIHPQQPEESVQGALQVCYELQKDLTEIAGMANTSLQPVAGAHGEITGLMIMKAYHTEKGNTHKNTIILPDSAHGTNPASVALVGYKVVEIKSTPQGMVDLEVLKKTVNENTAGFMLTNPNTLGLFETQILQIAKIIHDVDGLMYMDGANMNALLGLVKPGHIGFDIMHYNLHKTLSTPHGGGGPGSGPVAVQDYLTKFLPYPMVNLSQGHYYFDFQNQKSSIGKIHSYNGNFSTNLKAYTYIKTLGAEGLTRVAQNAIINANYLRKKLEKAFFVPHQDAFCMHEFVASGEKQLKMADIKALDIAKRLLDKGFHAPTIYFPLIVREAMMIEPTETESKQTLDDFIQAFLEINEECYNKPELVKNAPINTSVQRVDDVKAIKELNVRYKM